MYSAFEPLLDSLKAVDLSAGRQSLVGSWSDLSQVCTLLDIPPVGLSIAKDFLFQHVSYKAGQKIHSSGDKFEALSVVYTGFLKTVQVDELGDEQVLSFPMRGDIIGCDGASDMRHASDAVALSDCELITLPFKKMTMLGVLDENLEIAMYGILSREIARRGRLISMLGSLPSEARLARFLLAIGDRYGKMGYSAERFNLRMTRGELGSYLGLTQETVCRTMSSLDRAGMIKSDGRSVTILDLEALKNLRSLRHRKVPARSKPAAARTPLHLV